MVLPPPHLHLFDCFTLRSHVIINIPFSYPFRTKTLGTNTMPSLASHHLMMQTKWLTVKPRWNAGQMDSDGKTAFFCSSCLCFVLATTGETNRKWSTLKVSALKFSPLTRQIHQSEKALEQKVRSCSNLFCLKRNLISITAAFILNSPVGIYTLSSNW